MRTIDPVWTSGRLAESGNPAGAQNTGVHRMRSSCLRHVVTSLVVSFFAISCGGEPPAEKADATSASSEFTFSSRVHKLPWRDPATAAITPNAAPAGAHLNYHGGRVVSNIHVIEVLYGSGTFMPQVTATTTPSISSFYTGVTNSAYFDWLTEYNTPASGGTNQAIGRGNFGGKVQITPAASRNGTTITDAQIQAELAAQITAGVLPPVTFDAAGNVNTYYAVFFPHGKVISQGGSNSCRAGGFCAYHGTFTQASHDVYYGVHPDMEAGSGCDTGCGSNATPFNNQTSVASHEMIETVTDAEVGLATVVGPPLAWYDSTNGEIGDICNAQQGSVVGGDGTTYVVQTEFDNATNNCIVSKAVAGNNFSITASPTSLSLTAGGAAGTSTISTATTSGSAQTVSLSVTGAPAGVTATLSPTSVTSGGSSTLTVTASSTAAAGTFTLTVTGTAASGSHTASVSVTVGGGGGGTCTTTTQLLGNPGFETTGSWTATAGVLGNAASGVHSPRTGTGFAWLDGYGTTHTDTLSQTVTIPATACTATFTFWVKIDTAETTTTTAFDKLTVAANTSTLTTLSNLNHSTSYVQKSFNLIAFKGTSVTLKFTGTEDTSLQTSFVIDDTALTITQ
jgi:hypothetical protein